MNSNRKRGRPANVTLEQVVDTYWEMYKEREADAGPGEEVSVASSEVHKRLGTTASQTTVAKYLSQGLALSPRGPSDDSDMGAHVKEMFVRAGTEVVAMIHVQYQKLQAETQKKCMDEIALASEREEAAWARAEELEVLLAEREQRIDALAGEVKSWEEKLSNAALQIEGLEIMLDTLAQEKTGWIAELKQALESK